MWLPRRAAGPLALQGHDAVIARTAPRLDFDEVTPLALICIKPLSTTSSIVMARCQNGNDAMWWNAYGSAPWMLFGPFMVLFFVAVFSSALFFLCRGLMRHKAGAAGWSMECCGFGQLHQSDSAKFEPSTNGHSALDLYRADTLQRLEQERKRLPGLCWPPAGREGQAGV